MASRERRAAYRLGLSAETRAALWLRVKGYRILARRYRTPLGEIDLIARRRRTIIFVEVKARASLEAAIEALSPTAERRIEEAANLWLARHPDFVHADLRFDMVLVVPGRWPRHMASVWDARS